MNTSIRFLALAAVSLLGTAAAHAQTPTVITSLPYVITAKGTYVLTNDLNSSQTSGRLIDVQVSNVTIDFQGHYIAGSVGNTSQSTVGVYAYEQSNVTVKNGTIAFCYQGIFIQGNGNANTNAVGETIDNMRVTYCYYDGIEMDFCPASTIANCKISQAGYSGQSTAFGIYCIGSGEAIQNNTISTVTATSGYGIYAVGCFVRQNTVYSTVYGVFGGKYQDNLTLSCTNPYSSGIDAGGNN